MAASRRAAATLPFEMALQDRPGNKPRNGGAKANRLRPEDDVAEYGQ